MSNITLFNHEKFGQVRTLEKDGEVFFFAQEITSVLEYQNNAEAIRTNVDPDNTARIYIPELSNNYIIINESGLYELILSSKKPEAKAFRRWVTSEVLPSIRKHGVYANKEKIEAMLADPETMIRTLSVLKAEREAKEKALSENIELQAKITEDAPKVAFAESVNRTVDNLSIRDYAKVLYDENIKLGQNRLFHLLRMKKVLDSDNKPYQKYIDNGWFVLKLSTYRNNSTDNVIEYTQPRITGKGQIALRSRIIQWLPGEEAI